MIRFSHTIFALPFALLAAAMAWMTPFPESLGGQPILFHWQDLVGIVLCMVTARNASMAFNRLVDRKIDAENPRTQNRHLVTGSISVTAVSWFAATNAIAFVAATCIFWPNPWPLRLSVPVLAFLCGYSYTKRFTWMAHFWLGAALMMAPICAWIAIRGAYLVFPAGWIDLIPPTILGLAVMLWVAGFDIIYACQDFDFDVRTQLQSIPAKLGIKRALQLSAVCHLAMVLLLVALPAACPQLQLGWIYGLGIAVVAALLAYEHWLVRPNDLDRVNVAFFQVNAVISIGLLVIVTVDLVI